MPLADAALLDFVPHFTAALQIPGPAAEKLARRIITVASRVTIPRRDDGTRNKTPGRDRWDVDPVESFLTVEDPRYATEAECLAIARYLAARVFEAREVQVSAPASALAASALGRPLLAGSLQCIKTNQPITRADLAGAAIVTTRLGMHELPVEYALDLPQGGRHERQNIGWMRPWVVLDRVRRALRVSLVGSGLNADQAKGLIDKVQTKAYLTDKVTMPPHFSNRDQRWCTWVDSNQYAGRLACAQVELELLCQLFELDGAPPLEPTIAAQVEQARGRPVTPGSARCPITGEVLGYHMFVQDVVNAEGGQSDFHVGHLDPLTRGGKHDRSNIAWASEAGNRIQGNETLAEIESRLAGAVAFHIERDVANGRPIDDEHAKRLWSALSAYRQRLGKPLVPW